MNPFQRLKQTIKNNYERQQNGGHNFIPVGFDRFSDYYPGIIKESYTIWTANTGVGKSKLSRFICINKVLEFVDSHSEIKPIIVVFSLELSAQEYVADIICSKLHSEHNINLNYRELISITTKPTKLNKKILDIIDSYDDWVDKFNKYVTIYEDIKNPYGIYKTCIDIIKRNIKGIEDIEKDENGNDRKYWKYTDENQYFIPIIDTINLITAEKGYTHWDSMKKLSNDYFLTLKNYWKSHVHAIQQQGSDKERIESDFSGKTIESKLFPSIDGLADCKLTSKDATEVIGIFAPDRYEIKSYLGYDISQWKDNIRFIKLLKSRYSTPNQPLALFFNGATGDFEELPKAEDCNSNTVNQYKKKYGLVTQKLRLHE